MTICYLLFLHFFADFVLQSREMGQKKSEYPKWLFIHITIQFLIFFIGMNLLLLLDSPPENLAFNDFWYPLKFAFLNALVHGAIDWNIWKLYKWSVWKRRDPELFGTIDDLKKHWKYWEDHLFYATIGFDQFLHTITIVILYGWLI